MTHCLLITLLRWCFIFPQYHSKFMSLDISSVCRKRRGLEPQSYGSDPRLVALWHFGEPLPAGGPARRQAVSICQLKMAGVPGSSRTPAGRNFRGGVDEKGMRKDESRDWCKIYIKQWLLISEGTETPGWISWVRNMATVTWCLWELLCLDFLTHTWVYFLKNEPFSMRFGVSEFRKTPLYCFCVYTGKPFFLRLLLSLLFFNVILCVRCLLWDFISRIWADKWQTLFTPCLPLHWEWEAQMTFSCVFLI